MQKKRAAKPAQLMDAEPLHPAPGWLDEPHGPTDATSGRPPPGGVGGAARSLGPRAGPGGCSQTPSHHPSTGIGAFHRPAPQFNQPPSTNRAIMGKKFKKNPANSEQITNPPRPRNSIAGGKGWGRLTQPRREDAVMLAGHGCSKGPQLACLPPFLRSFCPPLTQKRPSGLSGRPISVSFFV